VGALAAESSRAPWSSVPVGSIFLASVLPEYRRRGIAKSLVERASSELRARGCKEVWGELMLGNHPAGSFWKSMGFEDVYMVQRALLERIGVGAATQR